MIFNAINKYKSLGLNLAYLVTLTLTNIQKNTNY